MGKSYLEFRGPLASSSAREVHEPLPGIAKYFHLRKESLMLDKNFIRENLDFVKERLAARGGEYPLNDLVAADAEWKNILLRSEELRRQRNEASEAIGKLKRDRP